MFRGYRLDLSLPECLSICHHELSTFRGFVPHEALWTRLGKLLVRDVADRRSEAGFGTCSDASTVAVR